MGRFRPVKAGSRQYKTGIPSYRDETFYMQSQDVIYEEFITRPGSRSNRTELYSGQPGSSNNHLIHHFAR